MGRSAHLPSPLTPASAQSVACDLSPASRLLSRRTTNWVTLNNRNLFSPSSGVQKSKIKLLAGPHSLLRL